MTGPEIRARIDLLALKLVSGTALVRDLKAIGEEIMRLTVALKRRPAKRRTYAKSTRMTEQLGHDITLYARNNPRMSHGEMAAVFKVNTARISETLNGKRQ